MLSELEELTQAVHRLESSLDSTREDLAEVNGKLDDLLATIKRELPFLKRVKLDKELRRKLAERDRKMTESNLRKWGA